VPYPPFAARLIQAHPVQATAGVGFNIVHYPFGLNFGFHHEVNVGGAHMDRQQAPGLLRAAFLDWGENYLPTVWLHGVGWLVHPQRLCQNSLAIGFDHAAPGQVVRAIYGTGGIAM
jgi:hypothetical protein